MIAVYAPVSIPGTAFDTRAYGAVGQGVASTSRAPVTESAQALRPVDPSVSPRDVRAETARDKPVGPPPTFEINVLQDMRARAAKVPPEPVEPAPEVVAGDAEADTVGQRQAEGDTEAREAERQPQPERAPVYSGTSNTIDPTVNLKI